MPQRLRLCALRDGGGPRGPVPAEDGGVAERPAPLRGHRVRGGAQPRALPRVGEERGEGGVERRARPPAAVVEREGALHAAQLAVKLEGAEGPPEGQLGRQRLEEAQLELRAVPAAAQLAAHHHLLVVHGVRELPRPLPHELGGGDAVWVPLPPPAHLPRDAAVPQHRAAHRAPPLAPLHVEGRVPREVLARAALRRAPLRAARETVPAEDLALLAQHRADRHLLLAQRCRVRADGRQEAVPLGDAERQPALVQAAPVAAADGAPVEPRRGNGRHRAAVLARPRAGPASPALGRPAAAAGRKEEPRPSGFVLRPFCGENQNARTKHATSKIKWQTRPPAAARGFYCARDPSARR